MDVFFSADDKQEYLDQLSQSASKHWCLVSNHAPFVVLAHHERSPADGSKKRNTDNARMVNFLEVGTSSVARAIGCLDLT
jgi:hypothetical protein